MDRIEFYLDGYRFAEATADRSNGVFFANVKFESPLELFKTCVDVMADESETQLEAVRALMRSPKGCAFVEKS